MGKTFRESRIELRFAVSSRTLNGSNRPKVDMSSRSPNTMSTYNAEERFEAERLHRAAEYGRIQQIERLILFGYDVNLFDDLGHTPLHRAVRGGQYEAVRVLLRHGADVNANDDATIGDTPLALAVQGEHSGLVCLLLKSGANPDIQGWMGLTARQRAEYRTDAVGREICETLRRCWPKS